MKLNISRVLVLFGVIFILNTLSVLTGSGVFNNITIAAELLLMLFFVNRYIIANRKINGAIFSFFILFCLVTLLHFILNENSDKSTLLKIFCPIAFFFSGQYLENKSIVFTKVQKLFILVSIAFLPFAVRFSQIVLNFPSNSYYSIFVNSNNFAYFFIVTSIVIYITTHNKKYTFLYIIMGLIFSKTIGALLGLVLGLAIFLRKRLLNLKIIILLIGSVSLLYLLIFYSNLAIFERIKNSYLTFSNLISSSTSIKDLNAIEYGDAMQFAKSGQSDLSFLFRIKNYSEILTAFSKLDISNMLFGNGFMTVKKITSTGLVAHNDYLGLIYEFGLIPSLFLFFPYFRILKKINSGFINIFFYSIAFYHFTENLYYNFLITALHFFLLGFVFSQRRNYESSPNK